MTSVLQENVTRRPYTLSLSTAARGNEVVIMADVTPVVFVVDDDISVRESLELLITSAGWQPETFASAQDFLARPRVGIPCCLVLVRDRHFGEGKYEQSEATIRQLLD